MHTSSASLVLAGLAATAAAETIHGALVFARHGDRTSKHYPNYVLTPLGAQQVFQVGSFYRSRYLSSSSPQRIRNISEFEHVPAQVWASAPDASVLLSTANAFLQGLYPPLGDIKPSLAAQDLANGTSVESPLSGYQYVTLHGINDDSPETIWIKGDDNCPALSAASADFMASAEFQTRLASTRDFYQSLYPFVSNVYSSVGDLSYEKAYDIFDVINVAKIHNASSAVKDVTDEQMFQLRTLADSAEFGLNFNASQPDRSLHAQTFAASVLNHLNQTVTSADRNPKLTLLAGSYDTFLAFFGLTGLVDVSPDFYGLPDYASTMAFELFTPDDADADVDADAEGPLDPDALQVRYLFRNGTDGALRAFPLFGRAEAAMPWADFVRAVQAVGIDSAAEWCSRCRSPAVFCAAYNTTTNTGAVSQRGGGGGEDTVSRGSWIAVLVVMVVAVAGNLVCAAVWLVRSRRLRAEKRAAAAAAAGVAGATTVSRGSESVTSYEKQSV
ncbi:hypothetical protein MYCTH_2305621 [Thermothelomyces thermophilus ATCC 42464]|uniref:Uncharacterized protein n=1 Tax=Thermothelomyces thermophilus (strain ATCC 42464 / BCRC 31852 / DSM 1799) TaxID=573729 RepID=G2QDP2_THET4|nr:uncharacterized protein MYCTH_2305621 [Thermothelomyces thermophilus ATCC 42464]AEO58353.1 hypothetical protein MYCTH_2305621 [Thermothelomyces thermophilus ATCC 42464]